MIVESSVKTLLHLVQIMFCTVETYDSDELDEVFIIIINQN